MVKIGYFQFGFISITLYGKNRIFRSLDCSYSFDQISPLVFVIIIVISANPCINSRCLELEFLKVNNFVLLVSTLNNFLALILFAILILNGNSSVVT